MQEWMMSGMARAIVKTDNDDNEAVPVHAYSDA